ncbi:fungal specific transcription factor domain containing protein [Pyrenophora tritici-repentis]|nr:fungal specific transcription factor domain containing protein [Pyrenophora tritici-repentis]
MPYGPPGESGQAFNQRAEALRQRQQKAEKKGIHQNSFTGYYFYLDHIHIDIDIENPHILPTAQTAIMLFDYYSQAVHRPFKILDEVYENQLRAFFNRDRGYTVNVCPKWKATLNLVFAIGARYSHLIGADWRADDHDHLVYMSRAVHLLQLDSVDTLISRPDQALIRASILMGKARPFLTVLGNGTALLLLFNDRSCQQGLVHDWHSYPSCTSCRTPS